MENGGNGNGNGGSNGKARNPLFFGSYEVRLGLKTKTGFEPLTVSTADRQENGDMSFPVDCSIIMDGSEFASAVHVQNRKIRFGQAIRVMSSNGQTLPPNRQNEWAKIFYVGMDFAVVRITVKNNGLRMDICVDAYRWITFGNNNLNLTRWVAHDIPLPLNPALYKTIKDMVSEKLGPMGNIAPAVMQMIEKETNVEKRPKNKAVEKPEGVDEEMAPIDLLTAKAATKSTGAEQATLTA